MCTEWLRTVVPASVEAERVFSSVGNVVTKPRTRLNEMVNALVFRKIRAEDERMHVCIMSNT